MPPFALTATHQEHPMSQSSPPPRSCLLSGHFHPISSATLAADSRDSPSLPFEKEILEKMLLVSLVPSPLFPIPTVVSAFSFLIQATSIVLSTDEV